jgi:HNH endonuclease
MTFPICMLCEVSITATNDSAEHIIQNAIGGRRTANGIICKSCNSTTGQTWDAELAAQLNGLCHFFDIKRDRNVIPAETVTTTAGETFKMLPGGGFALVKPDIKTEQINGETRIGLRLRSKREARKMLEGYKRKYPKLDVDAELAKASAGTSYPEGMIQIPIQIGGELSGRAIVKSALALAHDSGIRAASCEQALRYLRDSEALACFGYVSARDLVVDRPKGIPFHCVAVSGNPETGLLLGYVEYFGFLRAVVCLSEAYSGAHIMESYAIDPTTGKKLDVVVQFDFTRSDIPAIYDYQFCDHRAVVEAANAVIGPALARRNARDLQKVTAEAARYAFENCGAKPGWFRNVAAKFRG